MAEQDKSIGRRIVPPKMVAPAAVVAPAGPAGSPSDPVDAGAPVSSPAVGSAFSPWAIVAMARGIACFLGLFSLLNIVGDLKMNFNFNEWWIDFRPAPRALGLIVLAVATGNLLSLAVAPCCSAKRMRIARALIELLQVVLAWNIISYYLLLGRGAFHTTMPVPLTLFVALALGIVWWAAGAKPRRVNSAGCWMVTAISLAVCAVIFPVLQMLCFGLTDYRRPADAIVVFGARVHADGHPSGALNDRVLLACELYQSQPKKNGHGPKLILSGGPGEGLVSETQSMKQIAMKHGVMPDDIEIDADGLNTERTVHNAVNLLMQHQSPPILAVSHFYHLPRVKLTFQQAQYPNVFTVPVRRPLTGTPKYMLREVLALWDYYLRGLVE